MKNKLVDLNDHLFAQIERLSAEEISNKKLARELNRARGMVGVGKLIVENADLALEAAKFQQENNGRSTNAELPIYFKKPELKQIR